METINFIASPDTKLDLALYARQLSAPRYVVNQPLNRDFINIIVDFDYDSSLESEFLETSANIRSLRNVVDPDDFTPGQLADYQSLVEMLESAKTPIHIPPPPLLPPMMMFGGPFPFVPPPLPPAPGLIIEERFGKSWVL
jgi:hypothetical protein